MTLRQTLTASVILHFAILGALGSPGCGAASPAQREGYAAETARCMANERAIVDRPGTTAAEDQEALDIERARCNDALGAIYSE